MLSRYPTSCFIVAMGLILFGVVGCSKKGVLATAETEYSEAGSANPDFEGVGGQGSPAIPEHEPAGRRAGRLGNIASGSDEFTSSDLDLSETSPDQGALLRMGITESDGEREPVEGAFGSVGSEQEPLPLVSMGSSETGQNPLKGFEAIEPGQTPTEDRVEGGTLIAKADPSTSFESQIDALQQEQLAAAREGLQDVFFAYDSWRISEAAKESLREDAAWLEASPSKRVMVEGHCDERGSSAYNLVLGEKRAKAVREYLIDLGAGPRQVMVVSYGEERPFCDGTSEACYQLNRRGHFAIQSP